MVAAVLTNNRAAASWSWPIDLSRYDRSPGLRLHEAAQLQHFGERLARSSTIRPQGSQDALARLLRPLNDTLDYTGAARWARGGVISLLLRQMHERQMTFWGWDSLDWYRIVGPDSRTFSEQHQRDGNHRAHLLALAYLLGNFNDLQHVGRILKRSFAEKVFGRDHVAAAVDRVRSELFRWGYGPSVGKREIPNVVCAALLANRSPILGDLSTNILARVRSEIRAHSLVVVREVLILATIAIGLGVAGSLALSRVLETLLFEIRPTDATTLASACGVILAVSVVAAILPARRAMRVDPIVALRYE